MCGIYGADISPKAIAIAERNIKQAGVGKYITLEIKALSKWDAAPEDGRPGVMVTNPPYGERISVDDMNGLYALLGSKLKRSTSRGYHAWVIGYHDEYFNEIGLRASLKMPVLNGKLECELREYILFDGDMKSFKAAGAAQPPIRVALRSRAERAARSVAPKTAKIAFPKMASAKPKGAASPVDAPATVTVLPGLTVRPTRDASTASPAPTRGAERPEREVSENPLARRHSAEALRMLIDKQPSLPPSRVDPRRRRRGDA